MADTSILLKKTQEARLSELYQTKCDEVSLIRIIIKSIYHIISIVLINISLNIIGWSNGFHIVHSVCN